MADRRKLIPVTEDDTDGNVKRFFKLTDAGEAEDAEGHGRYWIVGADAVEDPSEPGTYLVESLLGQAIEGDQS